MVVYTPGTLPKVVGQEIYSLMETCDNDFVPPLSSRSQIGQENWTECAASASVDRLPILAKTWSTNKASMSVLGQHGTPLARVPADRGLGIDTVYWSTSPARLCAKMVASGVQNYLRRQVFNALARIQERVPKPPHVPHHSVTDCDAEPD